MQFLVPLLHLHTHGKIAIYIAGTVLLLAKATNTGSTFECEEVVIGFCRAGRTKTTPLKLRIWPPYEGIGLDPPESGWIPLSEKASPRFPQEGPSVSAWVQE